MKQALKLWRILREHRIDLVHVNLTGLANPVLLGLYLGRTRIVYTDHFSGPPPCRSGVRKVAAWLLHRLIALRVDRYVGVSEYVRTRLVKSHHLPARKTVTIYNGVNTERFFPRDRSAARRRLGLAEHRKVVLSVAMLIPEKGIQHLLEATAALVRADRIPELLVLIVVVSA